MKEEIEYWLTWMRPAFARHGGNIEFVAVNEVDGVVHVRLEGACKGCPMSAITLKAGIEATLIEKVPGVREVIAVS